MTDGDRKRFQPISTRLVPRFAGVPTFLRLPVHDDPKDVDVLICGAPFDGGTTFRPGARFERSLALLREVKRLDESIITKSGLMLGLGERRDEVVEAMQRLLDSGCEIVTIGQYLQPKREKLEVIEYVPPSVFDEYRMLGEELGFRAVFSGPFVRSSYMADVVAHRVSAVP